MKAIILTSSYSPSRYCCVSWWSSYCHRKAFIFSLSNFGDPKLTMIFDGLVCIYIYFSGGLTGKAVLLEKPKDSCASVRLALKHFLFAYVRRSKNCFQSRTSFFIRVFWKIWTIHRYYICRVLFYCPALKITKVSASPFRKSQND